MRGKPSTRAAVPGVVMLVVAMLLIALLVLDTRLREPVAGQTQTPAREVGASDAPDATVAALEQDKLRREIDNLRYSQEHPWLDSLRDNAAFLIVGVAGLIGGILGWVWSVVQWRHNQQETRLRRDQDRFQALSDRLDGHQPATRLNAAINLRTFLNPEYEAFHDQVLSLVVAHLRLRPDPSPPESGLPMASAATPLTQALVYAFREAYPLARDHTGQRCRPLTVGISRMRDADASVSSERPHMVPDADGLRLSHVILAGADLQYIRMVESEILAAGLADVDFRDATLSRASFIRCNLSSALFDRADLTGASFGNSDLTGVVLTGATLDGARFDGCSLTDANIENAKSLVDVRMMSNVGLSAEQRQIITTKGAVFEESLGPSQ